MSPSPVAKPSMLVFGMDTLHMRPEPYGVVTIISPWNYPVQLSLVAMVGAIAGGNCIILKPSEVAPATERVMAEELPKYLDPECFQGSYDSHQGCRSGGECWQLSIVRECRESSVALRVVNAVAVC